MKVYIIRNKKIVKFKRSLILDFFIDVSLWFENKFSFLFKESEPSDCPFTELEINQYFVTDLTCFIKNNSNHSVELQDYISICTQYKLHYTDNLKELFNRKITDEELFLLKLKVDMKCRTEYKWWIPFCKWHNNR